MKCVVCGRTAVWNAEDVHLCAEHFAIVKAEMWETIPARVIDRPYGVVYYAQVYEPWITHAETIYGIKDARNQTYVKIGTSVNVGQRVRQVGGRLLVTEPGRHYLERKRHTQFASQRLSNREIFVVNDDIRRHVAELRTQLHWVTHGPRELADTQTPGGRL